MKRHVRFIKEKYLLYMEMLINDIISSEESENYKLEKIKLIPGIPFLATCVFKYNNLKTKYSNFKTHVRLVSEDRLPSLEKAANRLIADESQKANNLVSFELVPNHKSFLAIMVFNNYKIQHLCQKSKSGQVKIMKDGSFENLEKRITNYVRKLDEKNLSLKDFNITFDSELESYIAVLTFKYELNRELTLFS